MNLKKIRSSITLLCAVSLILVLGVGQLTQAAVFITRAELRNGDELRLEGQGAESRATIFVDGVAMGQADRRGDFNISEQPFSSPTCIIVVSDGSTTAQATLDNCTPAATPTPVPPPTATPTSTLPPSSNQPPIANAGPDQTMDDSNGDGIEMVTLDGSGSTDSDGFIVSYEWHEDGNLLTSVNQGNSVLNGVALDSTAQTSRFDSSGSPGTNETWWNLVQQKLADAEYRPSENERGLQAPNRAHNLRTYFGPSGIRVHDRTEAGSPELVSISLAGMGRDGLLTPVAAGTVDYEEARVEIQRSGFTEWYENSAQGLEQGFTLTARPQGFGPLVLELAISSAQAVLHNQSIILTTDAGRELTYDGLMAQDATGKTFVSRLEVPEPNRIRLVIQDVEATYPLMIDPLLSSTFDALLESNQPDPVGFLPAAFGGSVASAGDVNGDGFADVIVGAPGWDGGDPHEGAAFVFLGSATGIVGSDPATAHARIESNQFGAQLGTLPGSTVGDVNGDGFDDILIGAHFYEGTYEDQPLIVNGAAFVFYGSAAGITGTDPTNADAIISANQINSDLGLYVSGAGDVNGDGFDDIIVGVPKHGTLFPPEIPPNQRSGEYGAALVFHGSPAGITGTGFSDADAVLLSYEDTGQPDPPIYGRIGSVWGAGDVNGDGYDDVVLGGSEIALFPGSANGIIGRNLAEAQSRVQPGGPFGFAPFRLNAAGAGDINGDGFADIIAGAPFRELEPFTGREEGAAFVFLGGPTGLAYTDTNQAHATFYGSLLAEWVGLSVAGAGDVDNDGYDDVLIGAREYPGSLTSEGVAYLFRGGPLGITANSLLDADVRIEARQSGAIIVENVGAFNIGGAGDVNGDGFDDVIVGKGYYDNGELNEGAAFIYLGEPWPANPNQPPVASAGADQIVFDIEDDGFETITVDGRASFDPNGSIVSYAWYEGETLLGSSPVLTTDLTTTGDHTLVLTVTDDEGLTRGDPVTVRVDLVDRALVFFDDFSSGFGTWATGGDTVLSSADTFPTPPQARLGTAGAFLRHSIDLPAGSTGITLDFWGKATQFAASDELLVKVSVDGGPFTVIKTITSAESNDTYIFYGGSAIPLGHSWFPATASNVVVEFESSMSTGLFYVDDVKVTALLAPTGGNQNPIADAGPDQSASDGDGDGLEFFTLDGSASSDPDGTLVSIEWFEGTTLLGTGATLGTSFGLGTHNVTLIVTDNDGATASDSTIITVNPNQPPLANAGADLSVTDGDGNGVEPVTLDGSRSFDPDGSIASYVWSEGADVIGNSALLTTDLRVGDHILTLTVTDNMGLSMTDDVMVSVLPGSTTSVVTLPLSAGVHTIELTVTDNDGATATDTVMITINPQTPPTSTPTLTSPPPTPTPTSLPPTPTSTPLAPSPTATAVPPTPTATFVPPTATPTAIPSGGTSLYLSSSGSGTVGGVSFSDEDILAYDMSTGTWSMVLDGSDVGLSGSRSGDIDALAIQPDGSILLSVVDATNLPDVGSVDPSDIVRFIPTSLGSNNTAGSFEWYFDGSDVGLSSSSENVDAITVLAGGDLVISTSGSYSVSGASGGDEDLILFMPTSLGTSTSGSWSPYFDGSDVGLNSSSDEDVWGTWVEESTGAVYLTTRDQFSVSGISGDGADIFICTGSLGSNTNCSFTLFWDGSSNGFGGEQLDAFAIVNN